MNIGFLTTEYVSKKNVDGGLANYTRKVAIQLAERGHRVRIFVLSDENSRWNDEGVEVLELKSDFLLYRVCFSALNVLRGKRVKSRGGENVTVKNHSNQEKARRKRFLKNISPLASSLSLLLGNIYGKMTMARAVWKEHGNEPFDVLQTADLWSPGLFLLNNGRFPVICRISSYRLFWLEALGERISLLSRLLCRLEALQVKKADFAFAPSEYIAKTFLSLENINVDVIRTPLDKAVEMNNGFFEEKLSGKKYLLYFGGINRIKGVDLLANVIPDIVSGHPELFFVFIGLDTGMPGRKKVIEFIKDFPGMPCEKILFYNSLPKGYLFPVIKNAEGVLIPSRVDNYPNACLEAQSAGVPVIASDNSSLEEMIEDGKTGFLFENGNPESIKKAVEKLLGISHEKKHEMKNDILKHAAGINSEDRIGMLERYYENALKIFHAKK